MYLIHATTEYWWQCSIRRKTGSERQSAPAFHQTHYEVVGQ
jgi:hypothetical protein